METNYSFPTTPGGQEYIDQSDDWLYEVLYGIRICFLPIVVLGTVTNVFNFTVLLRRDMRFLSTTVYLLALALADLGLMYFELLRVWFEWANIVQPERYFSPTYCKIANYTNGVSRDFSNWLIACLTMERLLMVASPYKAKHMCTVSMARRVTVGLLLVLCVPHVHSLLYSRPVPGRRGWTCWEDQSDFTGVVLAALVEFACGYIVIVIVFVLNVVLVIMIYRRKLPCLARPFDKKRADRNRRLTRTLLAVAIVFLVCETPRMIMAFINRFTVRTPTRRIVLNVSFVLSGVNHACNFFIYILASPRFRLLVLETFPFRLCKKYGETSPVLVNYRVQYQEPSAAPTRTRDYLLRPPRQAYEENTTMISKTPPPVPCLDHHIPTFEQIL